VRFQGFRVSGFQSFRVSGFQKFCAGHRAQRRIHCGDPSLIRASVAKKEVRREYFFSDPDASGLLKNLRNFFYCSRVPGFQGSRVSGFQGSRNSAQGTGRRAQRLIHCGDPSLIRASVAKKEVRREI